MAEMAMPAKNSSPTNSPEFVMVPEPANVSMTALSTPVTPAQPRRSLENIPNSPGSPLMRLTNHLRPLAAGGIRSSVFSLTTTALGTGVLSMPLAMQSCGLVAGSVLLVLSSCISALSGDVLVRCSFEQEMARMVVADETHEEQSAIVRAWTFLLELHLGPRAGLLMDAILSFFGSGVIVMYLVFIGEFLKAILQVVGVHSAPSKSVLVYATSAVAVPLVLPGSLGGIQWFAVAVVGVILYVAVLLVVAIPYCQGPSDPLVLANLTLVGAMRSFCIFAFCHLYHMNLYAVYSALRAPYEWGRTYELERRKADCVRMRRVIRYAVLACCLCVGLIAVTGYYVFRGNTNGDIIINFNHEVCPPAVVSAALVAQVLLSLSALLCIPINMMQTRHSILKVIGFMCGSRVRQTLSRPPVRHVLSGVLVLALGSLAAVLDAVSDVISFLSGAGGTILMFALPVLFYKKSGLDTGKPLYRCLVLTILFGATVAGFGNVVAMVVTKVHSAIQHHQAKPMQLLA